MILIYCKEPVYKSKLAEAIARTITNNMGEANNITDFTADITKS